MSEKMPTRGIRMPDEQWKTCVEMSKDLGYGSPSDFIRDAIEFYVEWTNRESSEKFLTPALESVVRGIVKDSEDRTCRLLFKMAVDLNLIMRIICTDYNYSESELKDLRRESVRIVALFNNLIKSLLKKVFIIPVLFLLAYAALIVFGLQFLPFWDWLLIKDIIIWVLFIATPICFKAAVNRKKNQYPFKRMVIDNFVWSAILEFFVGAFTFSFVAELVVVPAFSFLVLLQNHDRENEKLKDVHKLIDGISVAAGLVLLGFTVNAAIDVIKDEGITSVLVSFCIPIIFSIAFLPVVYMLAVRGKYHDLFFRIKIRNNGDERDLKIRKKAILRVCGLSYKKLCKFEHGYYSEYITAIHSGNDDETLLQFIKNFKG